MHYRYITSGTCSKAIEFDIDGDVITNISFLGGCEGNLRAISKLVNGWTVEQIAGPLEGNDCHGKGTSCADQLARAVREAYAFSQSQG